jgi:hypothetical protein
MIPSFLLFSPPVLCLHCFTLQPVYLSIAMSANGSRAAGGYKVLIAKKIAAVTGGSWKEL